MFNLFIKVAILSVCITETMTRTHRLNQRRANRLQSPNERVIIGILSQELPRTLASISPNSTSYIAASYVKWIEGQGARVVPIRINQPIAYYNMIFSSINGLLLPGGSASLQNSGYAKAGGLLYKLAIDANNRGDFFPIWGTCLGFELLLCLAAGKNYLTTCSSYDRALPLAFRSGASSSRLFSNAPRKLLSILEKEPSTSNFHRWCMTTENVTVSGLDTFLNPLATSLDDRNLTFVASFEARNYPIWGVQFHPEKNIYEWGESYKSIPHSLNAVHVGQYFGSFFVNQARQNTHHFPTLEDENNHLIYNHRPVYTGNVSKSFLQTYFFD